MTRWKDTTGYRQGDKERKPSCWSLTGQELHVAVLTGHRDCPDDWVMHCRQFGIDTLKIGTKADMTEAQAKLKALQVVRTRANRLISDINEAVA